jgi:hypothetical protein
VRGNRVELLQSFIEMATGDQRLGRCCRRGRLSEACGTRRQQNAKTEGAQIPAAVFLSMISLHKRASRVTQRLPNRLSVSFETTGMVHMAYCVRLTAFLRVSSFASFLCLRSCAGELAQLLSYAASYCGTRVPSRLPFSFVPKVLRTNWPLFLGRLWGLYGWRNSKSVRDAFLVVQILVFRFPVPVKRLNM